VSTSARGPSVFVLAPAPILTITIEAAADGASEIHLHPGGQGAWIARMLGVLGIDVTMCGSFGGEVGEVVLPLIEALGVHVRAVHAGNNGAYVHDRRSGEREPVAEALTAVLSRHEADELYGTALVAGLESDVCVLAGSGRRDVLAPESYRRLAADFRANGKPVVTDLSGETLAAVLEGGVDVVKVSHEELCRDGWVSPETVEPRRLWRAADEMVGAGAENVVITRADASTLARLEAHCFEIATPHLEPVDAHGAGDSLTAGIAAGLARGDSLLDALRLGSAAGTLNVTRRGLASGNREDIERLTQRVEVRRVTRGDGAVCER
jgi:1-phosphofructokinase